MPQAFGQANPLDRVVAEQQRMLQIETLGIRAVESLIQTGPGQIIGGRRIPQFEYALGIDQRTVRYYVQAGVWLGFLEDSPEPLLSPEGLAYVYGGKLRRARYAEAVSRQPFVLLSRASAISTPGTLNISLPSGDTTKKHGPMPPQI